jgi:peptidylprolyl isomerase
MSFPHLRTSTLALTVGAAAALGLAACSSSPSSPSGSPTTTTTTAPGATSTTAVDGGGLVAVGPIPAADRSPAGTFGRAPTVTVPTGAPPTALESTDLIPGNGKEAGPGKTVTVQYVLATYSSGKVVQSSWTSSPFSFTMGAGQVIPGWDKGLVGAKVGGRRELIIPPSLGYKQVAAGPGIAANDTLVFVVDVLNVN